MTAGRTALLLLGLLALGLAAVPVMLPLPGTLLVATDTPAPSDVALLLDGSGTDALVGVEAWRRGGLVKDVVVVETPVKTHALVAYWSDFVAWGLARPSPTPAEHLRVVRSASSVPTAQTRAALAVLRQLGARSVLLPGGGLGSKLSRQDAAAILEPAGISLRLVPLGPLERDPARWYENADDRRAVLDEWLSLVTGGESL